jgi:hypothetical protein
MKSDIARFKGFLNYFSVGETVYSILAIFSNVLYKNRIPNEIQYFAYWRVGSDSIISADLCSVYRQLIKLFFLSHVLRIKK